jgi:hypothetical protein
MLETLDVMRRSALDAERPLRCELCLTIGGDAEPEIRLGRSSGRRPFDALARKALARSLRVHRPPAELPATRACYRFAFSFHRVPFLPTVGCTFDEVEPSIDCYYPTKKVIKVDVALVSAGPAPG